MLKTGQGSQKMSTNGQNTQGILKSAHNIPKKCLIKKTHKKWSENDQKGFANCSRNVHEKLRKHSEYVKEMLRK